MLLLHQNESETNVFFSFLSPLYPTFFLFPLPLFFPYFHFFFFLFCVLCFDELIKIRNSQNFKC